MSFIELNLASVEEDKVAPEGQYDLVIESAKFKADKNLIVAMLAIESDENYATVFHNISLPKSDDDDGVTRFKMLFAKRFLAQFGIDADDGIDTEAFAGCRATCNLKQETYQNQVKNVIELDRLAAE